LVTGLDIAPDGKRMLVLTYQNAVEILVDFDRLNPQRATNLPEKGDSGAYRVVALRRLPQQEGIAYPPDGRGFLYDTEPKNEQAEIVRVDCLK
jgi:hypothetical protein